MLRFQGGTFDPASGELTRAGTVVRLEPQPARVLTLLLEHAGEVVSREELARRVWPAETHVDFDRGLNYCVARLRQALGDSAESPRFIETLPRRGYRFRQADSPPPPPSPPRGASWIRWVAGAMTALVLGFLAWGFLRSPSPSIPVIAVMAFDDETGTAKGERLAQNLTDGVVAQLARTPERWAVIGNAAILQDKRSFRDVKQVAAELRAGYVVLGQVQQVDGRVRVIAHLLRGSDETHLWANRFALGGEGEGALESEVAEAVRKAAERALISSSSLPHPFLIGLEPPFPTISRTSGS